MGRKKTRKLKVGAEEPRTFAEKDEDDGLLWVHEVEVRSKSERDPMSNLLRWKKKLSSASPDAIAGTRKPGTAVDIGDDDSESEEDERRQYSVHTIQKRASLSERALNFLSPNVDEHIYAPNTLFCHYINWTFRAGFTMVFMSFLCIFTLLTFSFGGFLELAGKAQPGCITVSGQPFGTNPESTLADAYSLSWTTFTTVGYGATYVATGQDDHSPDQLNCWVVNGLCTSESFIGLLYAGMCGAILFGKITRVQSHAQVRFASAICITFDPAGDTSDSGKPMGQAEEGNMGRFACPVLKFQVINELCNERGGEIMDAQLKMVAANNRSDVVGMQAAYRKVNLKEIEHPFFSRVWHGRHILDADSSLLSKAAKSKIRQNGGFWPKEWANAESIRNALQFTDIIVTLIGISNVSASTVHAYKRFKFGDVLVGYEHASVLYTNPGSHKLKVDMNLIDDVIEQEFGDGESLEETVESSGMSPQRPMMNSQRSVRIVRNMSSSSLTEFAA